MSKQKDPAKELDGLFKDFKKEEKEEEPEEFKPEPKEEPKPKPQTLKYKDEKGNIAEPQTLSDLERNNRILEQNNKITQEANEWNRFKDKANLIIKVAVLGFILWLVYYVIENNIFNNLVSAFRRC